MLKIFDSLKSLVSPQMISKAASVVGEPESKVSTAMTAIVPGLLGALLRKGDTPQLQNTLEQAGRTNILSDLNNVFCGDANNEEQHMGDKFLQNLLGDKVGDFTSAIASHAGISHPSSNRLTSMAAVLTSGFLGKKLVENNLNLSGLINELSKEKSSIMAALPAGLSNALGLSSVLGSDKYNNTKNTNTMATTTEKKKNGWLTWLIIIIALLLIIWWWRSCNRRDRDAVVDRTTEYVDTVRNTVNRTANQVSDRVSNEFELPNGVRINGYRDGSEDKLIRFLKNDYKNTSANDLRSKWFEMEDIEFEFNSATQLMNNSNTQVNNLVAILKAYDDTKVRIAGNADRVGSENTNMAISKERADHIKSLLVNNGIAANRITTEGHGEEYAKHRENAPDSLRAEDRDIAIRFVK